ncbi:hypothetical protein C8T65DRAFT_744440 [Cerioporus squamosus]|nr:hypothetical protein C8T65DRAFT_744440 [Cerioporus squamosus]
MSDDTTPGFRDFLACQLMYPEDGDDDEDLPEPSSGVAPTGPSTEVSFHTPCLQQSNVLNASSSSEPTNSLSTNCRISSPETESQTLDEEDDPSRVQSALFQERHEEAPPVALDTFFAPLPLILHNLMFTMNPLVHYVSSNAPVADLPAF